ncbi:hypothetical protein QOZ80_5AG0404970 [Eleusine coracana subsp. coracana]|nr:hypothetical protein QOZ80_5AG0404970 [Eleusine coracana subsp. coracana]
MAPAAAAVTVVLGDDLLREVFVRLPTPDDLVRAAAACKPFLHAARSPPFLRRFRRLHPSSCPRLLGCLLLRPGPDSAAPQFLLDCRNGRILVKNLVSQELGITDPLSRCYIVLPAPPTKTAVGWGLVADDGDSSVFRAVCVSRDAASRELRALVLSSGDGELSWADVAGVSCQPDLTGFRAMQANRGFCIEVWAGTRDGDGGMAWRRVDKSVRFYKLVKQMFRPSVQSYQNELDVVGVAADVMFVRQWDNLFSIDLETMKHRVLAKKGCSSVLIYPYTIAWPPSFLNPGGQGT